MPSTSCTHQVMRHKTCCYAVWDTCHYQDGRPKSCCYALWEVDEPNKGFSTKNNKTSKAGQDGTQAHPERKEKAKTTSKAPPDIQLKLSKGPINDPMNSLPENSKRVLVRPEGQLCPGNIPSNVPVCIHPVAGSHPVSKDVPRSCPPPHLKTLVQTNAPSSKMASPTLAPLSSCPCHCAIRLKLDPPNSRFVILQKVSQQNLRPNKFPEGEMRDRPSSYVTVTDVCPRRLIQQEGTMHHTQDCPIWTQQGTQQIPLQVYNGVSASDCPHCNKQYV